MYIGGTYTTDLDNAFKHASKTGATAIQFYNGDMQLTTLRTKFSPDIAAKYRDNPMIKVIHGMLRLNFCLDPEHKRFAWNWQNCAADLEFARQIGAIGVIIHVPHLHTKHATYTDDQCIANFIANCQHLNLRDTYLIIETTHTETGKLAGSIERLATFYNQLPPRLKSRIRFCIDTAHIFAYGYPINTIAGINAYFGEWHKLIGLNKIVVLHCNDSKVPLGAHIDRHEQLGNGYIFSHDKTILSHIVNLAYIMNWSIILETPDQNKYKNEIKLVRGLINIDVCIRQFEHIQQTQNNPYKAIQYNRTVQHMRQGATGLLTPHMREKCALILLSGATVRDNALLTSVYGIGPAMARKLSAKGIYTIEQLKNVDLPRSIQLGLRWHDDLAKRVPRAEQEQFAQLFLKGKYKYKIAGSYHRGTVNSSDIDIIILDNPAKSGQIVAAIVADIKAHNLVCEQITKNVLFAQVVKIVRHIDIRIIWPKDLMFYLFFFSSGKQFNRDIRLWAKRRGYKLTDKGLFYRDGRKVRGIKSERDIFRVLGHEYVPLNER